MSKYKQLISEARKTDNKIPENQKINIPLWWSRT
jgi:hypothetical protein